MTANAAKLAADLGLGGVYPESWEGFVGQESVKRQLIIACRSAKIRGATLDPILIKGGAPGIGKTTLALLIASELGGNLKVITGTVKPQQARYVFAGMNPGDVLFYDEIHLAAKGGNSEWLLHLLEQGVFIGPLGPEETPPISIIGATTDAGRLLRTVQDRFTPVELATYSEVEATTICQHMAVRIFESIPIPSVEDCRLIAVAGNHNPRQMRNMLAAVRDVAIATEMSNYNKQEDTYDLTQALEFLGLTDDGLDKLACRYLVAMHRDFPTGAGERAIKDRLQEPGGLHYTETLLMDKNLIAMTRSGRMLTADGIRRARTLREQGVAA